MAVAKSRIIANIGWKFAERTGSQSALFIITIILARLLLPEQFGIIVIVTVFIQIANIFVTSGFQQALIQKKNVDNLDYSSIFFANIGLSVILYSIIYFSAPLIADFYGQEILSPVLRVLGLRLIFAAINTVQNAYVAKNLIFNKLFYSTLSGIVVSGVIGVGMAYKGFGVWSLVAQQLISVLITTVVLWLMIDWRPKLQFSLIRAKILFSFGWKLLLAGLLNTFTYHIRYLIIGKIYSPSDLAYFERGLKLPKMIMSNINASISTVMFPVISKEQDNLNNLKMLTRKSIRVSSYIIFPIMMGFVVLAEPLVKLILTEKWLPSVPYLRIGCYLNAVQIIQIAIQNALLAKGKSDIFLKMDIISQVISITFLIIVMNHGVMAIALASLITSTFNMLMKVYIGKRLIGYSYSELFADNIPIVTVSVIMASFVYMVNFIDYSVLVRLIIQIPFGIIIYLLFSYLFKLEGLKFVLDFMRQIK